MIFLARLLFHKFLLKFPSRHQKVGCGQRQGSAGIVVCKLHKVGGFLP